MKVHYLAMIVTVAIFGFFGCSEKPESGTTETTEVNEQPASTSGERETMIDKVGESMTEAGNAISEAAKETGDAVEQGVESMEDAASEAADVIESNAESIKENMEQSALDSEPVVEETQATAIEVSSPVDTNPVEETVIEEKVEQVEGAKPVPQ